MEHSLASLASRVVTLVVRTQRASGVLTVWESREEIPRYWGEMRTGGTERLLGPRYSMASLEADAREFLGPIQ